MKIVASGGIGLIDAEDVAIVSSACAVASVWLRELSKMVTRLTVNNRA
jgi:hypothetical protein